MRVVRYRASSVPIRDAPEEVACRWVGLLETCGVVDRNFGGVPARHPDRLIKWFIEVVLLGVGVNLLSSYVVAQDWAWLPPARFVAALLVAVPSAGLLDRWPLVGVPSLLFGIAALPGGIAALLDDGPWWGRASTRPGHSPAAGGRVPAG
jgi:hypothetical protein